MAHVAVCLRVCEAVGTARAVVVDSHSVDVPGRILVMAYTVMAYTVMAYIAFAYIVVAY